MAKREEVVKTKKDVINEILPTRYRLKCKNPIQKEYANLITNHEIVIAAGPAGVGKSYVGVARAIELLQNITSPYNRILVSCPAEESGEKLGYIPGTIREKMDPYISSTIDIFDKIIGKRNRLKLEEEGILEIQPLGHIRGKSIDGTIFIMEEAQNMSPNQMKTFLTRLGENSKFIASGDLDQSDRYNDIKQSGLYDALSRHKNIEEIGWIEFKEEDIVRNPLIKKILNNYRNKVNKVEQSPTPPPNRKIKEGELPPPRPSNIHKVKKRETLFNKINKMFSDNFKW
jgi:phosphate starvation-inducible PhoH-like protein